MNTPTPRQRRCALLIVALAMVLGWWSRYPPAPRPPDVGPTEFSAMRALAVLTRILGDQSPHPIGSTANHAVRDRILAELRTAGLEPQLRPRFVCGSSSCATVENILVFLPRKTDATEASRGAVLLATHHDSVAAGPGASDDGHAVASAIEIARILKEAPTRHRDVWILIGDGEEIGLMGAKAFTQEPEYANVERVINLEARGTSGNGELFETHEGNAAVIDAVGKMLPHPNGSSINYEVYSRLPNDTDFSVFKRDGREGVNFAFIGNPARYHTPLDSLEYIDPRSVQDQGDNALASIRAFDTESSWPRTSNRVFFDVIGRFLVSWPNGMNNGLLFFVAGLWAIAGWRLHRQEKPGRRKFAALGLMSIAPLVGAVAMYLLGVGLHAVGATPALWTATGPVLTAVALCTAVIVMAWLSTPVRRLGLAFVVWGSCLPLLLVSFVLAKFVPGMTQTTLVPCLFSCVGLLAGARWGIVAGTLGSVAATATLLPAILHLYTALGYPALPGVTALAGLFLLPICGLLAEEWDVRASRFAALGSLAVLLAASVLLPAFDKGTPMPVAMQVIDGPEHIGLVMDNANAAFRGRRFTPPRLEAFGAPIVESYVVPWVSVGLPGVALENAAHAEHRPQVDVMMGSDNRMQLGVTSKRDARLLGLVIPSSISARGIRVKGQAFPQSGGGGAFSPGWQVFLVYASPGERVSFEMTWPAEKPCQGYVFDVVFQLPESAQAWKSKRDTFGVPVHYGDTHLVWDPWSAPKNALSGQ